MKNIKIGTEGVSASVYELISIINEMGCDDNLVYEINDLNISKSKPHPEFINRSKPFYKAFTNPKIVDRWASDDISYAIKIKDVVYYTNNTGSNTYLGGGPTSTLNMREFCFKNKIQIDFIESSLKDWLDHFDKLKNLPEIIAKKPEKYLRKEKTKYKLNEKVTIPPPPLKHVKDESVPKSYRELNILIDLCGEGITKTIETATKLNENNYRDLFLVALNSHKKYHTEGEALNRKGRTDLKARDKDRNTFIYEFKIHKGSADIKKGVDQITNKYVTIKNKFNGLVFINRKKGDLSNVLKAIIKEIKNPIHKLIIDDINTDYNSHKITLYHRHRRSKINKCILTIFLFDIQE